MVNRLPPLTVPPIRSMPVKSGTEFDPDVVMDFLVGQLIAVYPAVLDHPFPLDSDTVDWKIARYVDRRLFDQGSSTNMVFTRNTSHKQSSL